MGVKVEGKHLYYCKENTTGTIIRTEERDKEKVKEEIKENNTMRNRGQ